MPDRYTRNAYYAESQYKLCLFHCLIERAALVANKNLLRAEEAMGLTRHKV